MILNELKEINDRLQRFPRHWQGASTVIEAAERLEQVIFEIERLAADLSRPREDRTTRLVDLVERGATVTGALCLVIRQDVERVIGNTHGGA